MREVQLLTSYKATIYDDHAKGVGDKIQIGQGRYAFTKKRGPEIKARDIWLTQAVKDRDICVFALGEWFR